MCGIAGWFGGRAPEADTVDRVMTLLRHRGPNGQGYETFESAGLIHTRLSILDLSDAGSQPMPTEDRSIWVNFNGEIYNHRELQRELEGRGHIFNGHCDTEVLPHLYEEYGTAFLQRLRGMFAIAILDLRRRRLVLARDRFGIKPLFFGVGDGGLRFASELRALKAFPGLDLRPDPQAISDYTALLYVPAPQTFYRGLSALEPGQYLEATLDGQRDVSVRRFTYHNWTIAPDPSITLDAAAGRAEQLVRSAVSRQLEADVPLGSLLSGGIDSSLVASAAVRGVPSLNTFNVRFAESSYDETWAAQAVAAHIGSRHRTIDMGAQVTWDEFTSMLAHAGQPFADTSIFAVDHLSLAMRQHVTVALSGDGGDEAFGGYDLFGQLGSIARWQAMPATVRRMSVGLARQAPVRAVLPRELQRLDEFSDAGDEEILQRLFCWVRPEEQHRLNRNGLLPVSRWFAPMWNRDFSKSADRLEQLVALASEVTVRLQLPNDFLFKVDLASMRRSLEVRVPLLDEDLFAFALTLPRAMKTHSDGNKRVLREVARRWLPAAVASKEKHGFTVPVDRFVDSQFRVHLHETLISRHTRIAGHLDPAEYEPIVEDFCTGRPSTFSRSALYQRVTMLLALEVSLAG